jgi:hypothetical protein
MLSGLTQTPYNFDRLSRAWARYRRKCWRTVRAWRCGRLGTWSRCRARKRSWCVTRTRFAPGDINRVNAPAFSGATVITGHSPAESAACGNEWEVDHARNEAFRIAAPGLAIANRTAPISADCTIITTHDEAAAGGQNVLKRVSTVKANLQHATVETQVGIHARCFKVEVVPKGQLR